VLPRALAAFLQPFRQQKPAQDRAGLRIDHAVEPRRAVVALEGDDGLIADDPQDGPLLIANGPEPSGNILPMTAIKDLLLQRMGLPD
jgi:hypothetical protein